MAHVFPRAEVKKIVAKALGGWPVSNVVFRDEPEPMIAPKAGVVTGLVRLDLTSRTSAGSDDVTRIETPGGLRTVYGGQRAVTMTVRVESHTPGIVASDLLEGMRLRLNFEPNLDAWRRVGLALADWGAIVPLPNPVQNRMISTAALELFLNMVVELEDPVLGGVIEKVSSSTPVDPGAAPVVDLTGTFTI